MNDVAELDLRPALREPDTPGAVTAAVQPWQREPTAMDLVRDAIAQGAPLEVIREVKALALEMDQWQARKAFNEAFAKFKAEAVSIERNRKVTDGPLKGRRYAELVSFVEAATPALSAHGLSASWSITRDEKDWIEVTCVVEHLLGGSKQVSLGGPPDTGGAKNALQARISTVTYLERATFKAACGLAEQGDDDDGRAAGAPTAPITDKQAAEITAKLADTGADEAMFFDYFDIEKVADLPASKFDQAIRMLNMKKARQS